ncbi:membrane protein [Mycobacterium phage Saguaro]|uniref:Membrane protein n=1 Tax=Mycobacterium phage Saguaro TaxID=2315616 RepID=A0A386KA36_9CAUD|nr:membrane protein [Mycobacterium phage Saguaro]AYD82049.1 membrane protein [Mycobacterium phage Saguaro]
MKKLLVAAVGSVMLAWSALVLAPAVQAVPGQCGSAVVFGSGGGFCDGPPAADGTWMHCEHVYVLGFGGYNCFRVRPVPTDVDPRGWVPA